MIGRMDPYLYKKYLRTYSASLAGQLVETSAMDSLSEHLAVAFAVEHAAATKRGDYGFAQPDKLASFITASFIASCTIRSEPDAAKAGEP